MKHSLFIIDYAAMHVYIVSKGISYAIYNAHRTPLLVGNLQAWLVTILLVTVANVYLACWTRLNYRNIGSKGSTIRFVMITVFVWTLGSPWFARYICPLVGTVSESIYIKGSLHTNITYLIDMHTTILETNNAHLFWRGVLWFTLAGVTYSFHFPERIYPYKWDNLGNSHQIFHIIICFFRCERLIRSTN